jgi:hypothetical protein
VVLILTATACSQTSAEQILWPRDLMQLDSTAPKKEWQGLVVTDNPYMLSDDRLEEMNKGSFGGY